MTKKFGVTWIVVAFFVGILLGGTGGGLYITWKVIRYEADAITQSVAENAMGVIPALAALNEEDIELRLERFESAARAQIIASIVAMHFGLRYVTEEKGKHIKGALRHIAINREKLRVGKYGDPVRNDIEDILKLYVE